MKLEKVFGVSKDPVESYIERDRVDARMVSAISQTRQIIVYGSSKQGKTALVQRHLPEKNRITVHCSPSTTTEYLYRSLLRQLNVEVITEKTTETSRELGTSVVAKFTALIPLFGKAEAETEGSVKAGNRQEQKSEVIEFNLSLAQDVGELLHRIGKPDLFYVIENFHYLTPEVQSSFAFDLRTFEEMGLRFIILGVWREANRLIQFNGDLQDRVSEIPVEPWENQDFETVLMQGEKILNIEISAPIKERIYREAHGSVAVVQELAKKVCEKYGITETTSGTTPATISDITLLEAAISEKVNEYSARHVRSLESIAAGSRTRRTTEETAALYLPYYMVKVLVNCTYSELKDGIERKQLQELIKNVHSSPDNVRTSDVTGMLLRLSALQANANIVPPLFDFDRGNRRVKIVDSTLYFFIDNCDPEEVMAEIPHPDPNQATNN